MFQITSDYQSEIISDWCVFRLASDWFQIGFRLVSDWHEEFQITPSDFRLLQIASDSFQTGSHKKNITDCHFRL